MKRFLNCARITNPRKCMAINGACAWRDEAEVVSARELDEDEYYEEWDGAEDELFDDEQDWADDEWADDEMASGEYIENWPDAYAAPHVEHDAPSWYLYAVASIAMLLGCFLCLVAGCGMGACAATAFIRYSARIESKKTEMYESVESAPQAV